MKHTGNRPHVCHLCQDTFCRSDILKRHYARCLAKFQSTGKLSAVSRVPKRIVIPPNPGSPGSASVGSPEGYQNQPALLYSYQSNTSTPLASPSRSGSMANAGSVTPTNNVKYLNNLSSPASPTFQQNFDKQFLYQPAPLPVGAAATAATMGMSIYTPDQQQMKYDAEVLNGYYHQVAHQQIAQQQQYSLFYPSYTADQLGLGFQQQPQQHPQHHGHQRHLSYFY